MIRLSRRDLQELATVIVVANTPRSLFKGLLNCNAVIKMKKVVSPEELLEYYDRITARADRDEIVMGLAYGVLISMLLNERNMDRGVYPDVTRLSWGQHIDEAARSISPPIQILNVSGKPSPRVEVTSPKPSSIIISDMQSEQKSN